MIGREELVLVEGPSHAREDILTGHTDNYKIVNFPGDKSLVGQFVPVKIMSAKTWHLTGQIANKDAE